MRAVPADQRRARLRRRLHLHRDRHGDVGPLADACAEEFWGERRRRSVNGWPFKRTTRPITLRVGAELTRPERVAQHRHRVRAGRAIVIRRDQASGRRGHAEERVVVAGDHLSLARSASPPSRRPTRARIHVHGERRRRRGAFERASRPPQRLEHAPGEAIDGLAAIRGMAGHVGHDDERFGMRDREGLQQDGVEQAEHGGVGADPEAEGEDRGGRESGRTRQPAQAVARRRCASASSNRSAAQATRAVQAVHPAHTAAHPAHVG